MSRKKPGRIRELLRFLNSMMLKNPVRNLVLGFFDFLTIPKNPFLFIDDSNQRYAQIAFSTPPEIFFSILREENQTFYEYTQELLADFSQEEREGMSKYLELLIIVLAGLIYDIFHDQPEREFKEFLETTNLSEILDSPGSEEESKGEPF